MAQTIKAGDNFGWTANFDEHFSTMEESSAATSVDTNAGGGFADFADFASFDDHAPLSPNEIESVVASIPNDHLPSDREDINFGGF